MIHIGEKIRKIRNLKGLSQEYVACELDISQVALSDIENNKTKLSVQRLEKLSSIFEMPVSDILSFDEKQTFHNTFNDTSKGFFNVHKVIDKSFKRERNAYLSQIKHLEEEVIFLRNQLEK